MLLARCRDKRFPSEHRIADIQSSPIDMNAISLYYAGKIASMDISPDT